MVVVLLWVPPQLENLSPRGYPKKSFSPLKAAHRLRNIQIHTQKRFRQMLQIMLDKWDPSSVTGISNFGPNMITEYMHIVFCALVFEYVPNICQISTRSVPQMDIVCKIKITK